MVKTLKVFLPYETLRYLYKDTLSILFVKILKVSLQKGKAVYGEFIL